MCIDCYMNLLAGIGPPVERDVVSTTVQCLFWLCTALHVLYSVFLANAFAHHLLSTIPIEQPTE